MKKIKSLLCVLLCLVMAFSTVAGISASAASISSNKHTATKVKGGQTVYICSNTGWNTELFGNKFRTQIQINLGNDFQCFQYHFSIAKSGKVNVSIYKKSGSKWVKQNNLSGNFNVNSRGYISEKTAAKTFVLPGKGVQYKVIVTPVITDSTREFGNIYKASDMDDITVKITSYGTIKSVS